LIDKRDKDTFTTLWPQIQGLSKFLIKAGTQYGWFELIPPITELFWDIIMKHIQGGVKLFIPDEERPILFNYGWLTYVAKYNPPPDTGAGRNLSSFLRQSDMLQDFIGQYESAKTEYYDFNIPDHSWEVALAKFKGGLAIL
jgi:hypothetical protein